MVELWLTSEDTGAYGRDIGVTLPGLLWQLVEVIPEGAMLRIGMTNPPYILEHLEVREISLICMSSWLGFGKEEEEGTQVIQRTPCVHLYTVVHV